MCRLASANQHGLCGKERTMNKKTTTVAIFIFILIVMFFLFPKSCQQAQGKTVRDNSKTVFLLEAVF
jgi:hypothetical protein